MLFFFPLISEKYLSNQLAVINTTAVTIGSTAMNVTNYEHSSQVILQMMGGCNGEAATRITTTVSNWALQAGHVPGTNFTLLTQYFQQYSIESNSSSPSKFTLAWRVASFAQAWKALPICLMADSFLSSHSTFPLCLQQFSTQNSFFCRALTLQFLTSGSRVINPCHPI